MKEHHLQLNLTNTKLLVFPATPTLQHDFEIQLGSSTITPSASVRNLGVIFDVQLTFKDHIAKTARSCRFALHNIRKIRPFLTEHAAQLLVQALVISRLDYCNALLNWKIIKIYLYSFLPLLACTYLNNAWDLVLQVLPLSVCLFKINRFMNSPIESRFG